MRKLLVLGFMLTAALVSASALAETDGAPGCSGFPWTVTATPFGGDSVAVRVCGTFAGCRPHNPQFSISGSEIRITLTQAELPDCICLGVTGTFQQAIVVHPIAPGNYTVQVTMISCGQPTAAGSGSFVFGAASTIPALGPVSAAVLAILLAAVAVLRLRG